MVGPEGVAGGRGGAWAFCCGCRGAWGDLGLLLWVQVVWLLPSFP